MKKDPLNLILTCLHQRWEFQTPKGVMTLLELFQLPLTSVNRNTVNLNSLAFDYDPQRGKSDYVTNPQVSPEEKLRKDKFEVILLVIAFKEEVNRASYEARATKEHNDNILKLIERKNEEQLSSLSVEELQKLLR